LENQILQVAILAWKRREEQKLKEWGGLFGLLVER
jgi:hypothetical protein